MQAALHFPEAFKKLFITGSRRMLTQSYTGPEVKEITSRVKLQIEDYWHGRIGQNPFDPTKMERKFYVLSMIPYPSGALHMGHVRVYTISDTIARFYRMNGYNVLYPIGWDSFGLPAENAAIERNVEPAKWTIQNIFTMKNQLQLLGCSFDWQYELSTASPEFYKWTQKLFLLLHQRGLVYQNEALVNWDPIDKTVLADEQVDEKGCSWRSGAQVEKKLLKQWFIRTTAFAEKLYRGLEDPMLYDWRDIINLQRHWIGLCNGYAFHLLTSASNYLRVWTENPEHLKDTKAFVVLKRTHFLSRLPNANQLRVENPFLCRTMPVAFSDMPAFPDKCDVYLAAPTFREEDHALLNNVDVHFDPVKINTVAATPNPNAEREEVLEAAQRLQLGGYKVSSKLQDWLISRQRYWGTPIPIVHCEKCGAVPVSEEDLPVLLPPKNTIDTNAMSCSCPVCGSPDATREKDTMDTFVDSSWYYLRFLDHRNMKSIFDKDAIHSVMPVDVYVGGKEHAVLHLYYARFINAFLHSEGMVPTAEPFSRLLIQGMVMGQSYRLEKSGRYVKAEEVEILNSAKNRAVLKSTKEPVIMAWEKMSKSKYNGVDPNDMYKDYGIDTTRLIILANVAPTSHRNWSDKTFPGILNWQKRLWLTLHDFYILRTSREDPSVSRNSQAFDLQEQELFDARNYYIKGATFNIRHTYQISVAISKMQGLTNSIRRSSKAVIRYGKQYELTLATQLIMLAPLAPHFASELWAKFATTPNRLNVQEIDWDNNVLDQRWPKVDIDYKLDLKIKINGNDINIFKIASEKLNRFTQNEAMDVAFNSEVVLASLIDRKIRTMNFILHPGIEGVLNIYV